MEGGESPREQNVGSQAPRELAWGDGRGGGDCPWGSLPAPGAPLSALTLFVDRQALLQLGWSAGSENFHDHLIGRT